MTRDCPVGQTYFAQHQEVIITTLKKLLNSEDSNLVMKACVVLRHLCHAKESIKTAAINANLVPVLTQHMDNSEDESVREMANLALQELASRVNDKETLNQVS